jgi:hypothetical protein
MSKLVVWSVAAFVAATALLVAPGAEAARRHATHATRAPRAAAEALGTAGAWSAYVAHETTGPVCYLAGQPEKSEASGVPRRQPMAMVTHRPAEHVTDVVSIVEGYPLKRGSTLHLDIDNQKFDLFTAGDSAWARTSELDHTIVGALARGVRAVATGEAENGRRTTDSYSLVGFSKALTLIDKACGVSRTGEVLPRPQHHVVHHREPHRPVHHAPPRRKPVEPDRAKASH